MLTTVFHLVGAVQFAYGCYYDAMYVHPPTTTVTSYGGKLKYLTYINAMLIAVYFTVSFLNDLIGTNDTTPDEKPMIRRLKDILFSCLSFPLSMFVGLSFWGIYAIDRELILPRSLDAFFPGWLNHVMHTNILIFILIDLVASFRMYPTKKTGMSILSLFMLCYMIWIHIIYFSTGNWVYPILNVLNWPLRIVFYLFSISLICGLYTLGETLNRSVWSKEIEQAVKSGKKKAK